LTTAALAAGTAEETAIAFCATRTAGDAEGVKPLLTPELLAKVNEAERRNDIIQQANPDEKPPFGDGIPYQSFPDLPSACSVGAVEDKSGKAEIAVTYEFAGHPGAGFTDTLVLVPADGGYLVDDIRFTGSADGSANVGLGEILSSAFDQ
jgi:hypothetical protein